MSKCDEEFKRIQRRIRLGATRGKSTDVHKRLKRTIQQYGERCNQNRAESLNLFLDMSFNQRAVDELVETAKNLLNDPHSDGLTRITCLHLIVRLTILSESWERNVALRAQALQIARADGLIVLELITQINWLDALIRMSRYEEAVRKVEQIEELRSRLSMKVAREKEVYEVTSRYLTHRAKLTFWRARHSDLPEMLTLIDEANSLYAEAVQRDSENEHFSSNERIEWAEELLMLQSDRGVPLITKAEDVLRDASHSLNAHQCSGFCGGYYHHVQGLLFEIKGNVIFNMYPEKAIKCWLDAKAECDKSISLYEKVNHPESRIPQRMSIEIEKKLEIAKRPRKIFLSHKWADKPLVREFKKTLELLRLEPWLDEDDMKAGAILERDLLKGFKDSCAAIFFVTSSFKDSNYISTEIDYAVAEKRKKGRHFAIITLVFQDKSGQAQVPELLERFVWKIPKSNLEALQEIIKALPLTMTYPDWKETDVDESL